MKIFNKVLKGIQLEEWMPAFAVTFEQELSSILPDSVHPLVRCDDWYYMGSLKQLELQGRKGSNDIVFLTECSPVLHELSGLPDNIPFHVFMVGETKEMQVQKRKWETDNEHKLKIAEALKRTVEKLIAHDARPVSQPIRSALRKLKGN